MAREKYIDIERQRGERREQRENKRETESWITQTQKGNMKRCLFAEADIYIYIQYKRVGWCIFRSRNNYKLSASLT